MYEVETQSPAISQMHWPEESHVLSYVPDEPAGHGTPVWHVVPVASNPHAQPVGEHTTFWHVPHVTETGQSNTSLQ